MQDVVGLDFAAEDPVAWLGQAWRDAHSCHWSRHHCQVVGAVEIVGTGLRGYHA